MFDMNSLGKTLVLFGLILAAIGAVFTLGGKFSWFGRLPGDIYIQRKNFTFFFPIATSILISIIVSVVIMLIKRR